MIIIFKDLLIGYIFNEILFKFRDAFFLFLDTVKESLTVDPTFIERLGERTTKRKLANYIGGLIQVILLLTGVAILGVGIGVGFVAIKPFAVELFSLEDVNGFLEDVKKFASIAPFAVYAGTYGPIFKKYIKRKKELKISMFKYSLQEIVAFMASGFVGLFSIFLCLGCASIIAGNNAEVFLYTNIAFINLLMSVSVLLIYYKLKEAA